MLEWAPVKMRSCAVPVPPNEVIEPTARSFLPFAGARAAPIWSAAHPQKSGGNGSEIESGR